ncbi:MAG: response regulator transcription factor [Pseudomonadota bacterium]
MSDSHVLVVDDDDRIRTLLKRFLIKSGYRVTAASDAATARRMFSTLTFDLAILDIMMPVEDGLSLLSSLREKDDTPVILLTARGMADDRIEGLKRGADDYMSKPFEPEELALRVGAVLKRAQNSVPLDRIVLSGRVFDADRGALGEGKNRIRLTETEVVLLKRLAESAGEAVSRADLAQISSGSERSVDVQVTRLRRKIEKDPREPVHLQTVRGVGYRLLTD